MLAVVPYVENSLYPTNKYSCDRPVHTLYVSYFIEHNGDDEPYDSLGLFFVSNISTLSIFAISTTIIRVTFHNTLSNAVSEVLTKGATENSSLLGC